jgi:hypothetical protein
MVKVQALCDKLVANDAALTILVIMLKDVDDAELKLILGATKKNKTVKAVRVVGYTNVNRDEAMSLSVPAALSLASAVSEHPEIQEFEFVGVTFIEFGPIALAIVVQQNPRFTRLIFYRCRVTPNLVECIRWLLTENALESLVIVGCTNDDEEPPFDISGTLLGSSSLK